MRRVVLLSVTVLFAASGHSLLTVASPDAAITRGDAARGAIRSAELYCDACHGQNGNSDNVEWPSLAGQNADYMAAQLKLLRSGARVSPEMQPMAEALSDADIVDLAAHYAAQTLVTQRTSEPTDTSVGEELFTQGDPARSIPACSSCHGADGRGTPGTNGASLRAQQPVYISRQLEAYANRTRYTPAAQAERADDGNLEIMYGIAKKMTPEEVRSIAGYLHSMH